MNEVRHHCPVVTVILIANKEGCLYCSEDILEVMEPKEKNMQKIQKYGFNGSKHFRCLMINPLQSKKGL